jgi:hypothetical protein
MAHIRRCSRGDDPQRAYASRDLGEPGRLELAAVPLVVAVGVTPGPDRREVGLELFSGWDHDVLERRYARYLVRASGHRQIDRV